MARRQASSPFSNREFRLLFGGGAISAIGDQFTLVALPWLVLQLTGDPAQLGLVLAVMALPRAAFMLIGGAIVDRMSPRRVLLSARSVNAVLAGLLAALVLGATIHMWSLYLLAVGIGLASAFAYPAGGSILPQLLAPEQLQPANAMMMGMRQLSLLIGPALAGFVISAGSVHGVDGNDAHGTGLAFAVDAISFLASVVSLMLVRISSDRQPPAPTGSVLANVRDGIRAMWRDTQLRALISYMGAVSLLVMGPLQVGLPLLAKTRLDQGAAAFGLLMTANGAGMLVGGIVSTPFTRLMRGRLGLMVLSLDSLAGLAFATLSVVHSTLAGAALLVVVGCFAGTVQIAIVTWLQRRVEPAMMGRTMSFMMFTFLGLAPLAAALAGALLKLIPLAALFLGSGLALSLIALTCLSRPNLRAIRLQSTATP